MSDNKEALATIASRVAIACLLTGSSVSTAYATAAGFVKTLEEKPQAATSPRGDADEEEREISL